MTIAPFHKSARAILQLKQKLRLMNKAATTEAGAAELSNALAAGRGAASVAHGAQWMPHHHAEFIVCYTSFHFISLLVRISGREECDVWGPTYTQEMCKLSHEKLLSWCLGILYVIRKSDNSCC